MFISILETYSDHKFIISGDFNAKFGQLNQAPEDAFICENVWEHRHSEHNFVDNRSKTLVNIMKSLEMYVLNGRTTGDLLGNFTFANSNEKSTIDLVWANIDLLETVNRF